MPTLSKLAGRPADLVDAAFSFSSSGHHADGIPGPPSFYISLLKQADAAGSIEAARILGDEYYFGSLIPNDPVMAYFYYSTVMQGGTAERRAEAS
jgi:TPR repeat protein